MYTESFVEILNPSLNIFLFIRCIGCMKPKNQLLFFLPIELFMICTLIQLNYNTNLSDVYFYIRKYNKPGIPHYHFYKPIL
jgi:hypothetical protein